MDAVAVGPVTMDGLEPMDWHGDAGWHDAYGGIPDEGPGIVVADDIPPIDIVSYANVLLRYFADRIPMVRVAADVAVIVIPDAGMDRLEWEAFGAVSVRVTHVGERARPVLTWQCSC